MEKEALLIISLRDTSSSHGEITSNDGSFVISPNSSNIGAHQSTINELDKISGEYGGDKSFNTTIKEDPKRHMVENTKPDTCFVFDTLAVVDIVIQNWEYIFGGGAGWKVLSEAKDILLKWMETEAGREVEIKYGNKSIRIKGGKDIDRAIKAIKSGKDIDKM